MVYDLVLDVGCVPEASISFLEVMDFAQCHEGLVNLPYLLNAIQVEVDKVLHQIYSVNLAK